MDLSTFQFTVIIKFCRAIDGGVKYGWIRHYNQADSAPLFFSTIGYALQWVTEQKGIMWVDCYIDDFFHPVGTNFVEVCHQCSHNEKIV